MFGCKTNIYNDECNHIYVLDDSISAQQTTFSKPLVKQSDADLRKSCEPFLQDGSCSEVTPKLMKCRECKMTPTQRGKTVPNIFCRFYAFRRYVVYFPGLNSLITNGSMKFIDQTVGVWLLMILVKKLCSLFCTHFDSCQNNFDIKKDMTWSLCLQLWNLKTFHLNFA